MTIIDSQHSIMPSHWRPIRSYVRRGASRMSRAQQQAYQRLASTHCITIDSLEAASTYFPHPQRPLIIEIGSGMGQATAQLARQRAAFNYLAFEVHRPGVARLLWFIGRYALKNIKIVEKDCIPILAQSQQRLLEGAHIHFPDPWPKRRHHKRRLINKRFFMTLIPLLRGGGYISIVTDNHHYAQSIMADSCSLSLLNPYDGFAPHQQWRFSTAFELRAQQAGQPIYELFLRAPTALLMRR